jgi:hypothetical protein
MAREVLSDMQDLANEAQAGPWFVAMEIDGIRAGRQTVVQADGPGKGLGARRRRVVTVDQTRSHWDETAEANAQFIANARTDVPMLVAALLAILDLDDPSINYIIDRKLTGEL